MNLKKENTAIICLSPYAGGMELDAIKLANKLSKVVNVVLVAKENKFIEKEYDKYIDENNKIDFEAINFKKTFSLNIIKRTRCIVKKYDVKNVIFFGASELKSLYFAFLGLDINLIVRHGTTKTTPKKDLFHRLIYSQVNYHVSICKHLQKNVEYIIPFGKNSNSKLIYSSLEAKYIQKKKNEKLTLLHIGRIAKGKGQEDAIKACEVLFENNIDFEFFVVGGFDKDYEEEFIQTYNSLKYKGQIKLVGFVRNIQEYLNQSDIFLFPSYGEGLSNSFLEALGNRLTCISYNNTSFPELKEIGFEFLMATNRDIEKLKSTLLLATKELKVNNNMLNNNEKLVKEKFSLKREIDEYLSILI